MIDARALRYARAVLEAVVRHRPPPSAPDGPGFHEPASAFVTLRCGGVLRGCLGDTGFERPFHEVIRRMTEAAATSDPRFPSIASEELMTVSIEISRLTPPRPATIGEIEVGRHGIIVALEGRRGLLLPQVGVEFECDAEEFVALGCRKAGLPMEAVRHPNLALSIFEAEVLSE